MSALAGTKRSATTPFASPATKKSRTQYDYGDVDDLESSPQAGAQESISDSDTDSLNMEDDLDAYIDRLNDGLDPWDANMTYQKDRPTTGVSIAARDINRQCHVLGSNTIY